MSNQSNITKLCIIYIVTCIINRKYYIGQTINTLAKRWAQHKSNAKKKLQKCKFLENAIEKYGHENFTIEALLYCSQDQLNFYETKFIDTYMSNDRRFGYNICEGGGGSVSRPVTDEHRQKISIANKKTTLNINIQEQKDSNGVLTGYVVAKYINKVRYNKNFGNTKNSLEENLQLATQWLEDLNLGKIVIDRSHKNISEKKNKHGVIIGYQLKIERDGKNHCKVFTKKTLTMNEKLQLAIDYRNNYLEELKVKTSENIPEKGTEQSAAKS